MSGALPFENRIIEGDCIEVMKAMPQGSIDLVVTDPPYLLHYRARDGRSIANDDNDKWLSPSFREIARVLKPGGFCISFYGWNEADRFIEAWRTAGLRPVGHFVFVKPYNVKARFTKCQHECAYLLAKGEPKCPAISLPDVFDWTYSGNVLHPTQKPLSAIIPLVLAYSRPGDIVLDPFAGSATTALAAKILGRRFVGIELDTEYARLANERLARLNLGERA